ncbi:MAG: MotA/TolQ/ExbB proton channel family protein [Phycisphaerales bacterium]
MDESFIVIPWLSAPQQAFLDRAIEIWIAGGWSMWAIAFVAFVMCALGASMVITMVARGMWVSSDKRIARMVAEPARRRGNTGRLIESALSTGTLEGVDGAFAQYKLAELASFDRKLRMMKICVGTAPLLGLFGTVTGMLATFAALSSGSGGEKTMAQIAEGISEALITTETGLVVALPGLFLQYQVARRVESFKVFLGRAEHACHRAVRARMSSSRRETAAIAA